MRRATRKTTTPKHKAMGLARWNPGRVFNRELDKKKSGGTLKQEPGPRLIVDPLEME